MVMDLMNMETLPKLFKDLEFTKIESNKSA